MLTEGGRYTSDTACSRCSGTGQKKGPVRTVDTDVVVLAVTFFSQIKPDEMGIAFSTFVSWCHE